MAEILFRSVRDRIMGHATKGHRLELRVEDHGTFLRCLFCGHNIIRGSDHTMKKVEKFLAEQGYRFDVWCRSESLGDSLDLLFSEEMPLNH